MADLIVYAVECEPGLWSGDGACPSEKTFTISTDLETAEKAKGCEIRDGYPAARVVRFRLVEVKED